MVLLAVLLIGWGCLMASCSDHADDETDHQDEQKELPLNVASLTRNGSEGETEPSQTESETDPLEGMSLHLLLVPQNPDIAGTNTLSGQVRYGGKNDANEIIWHSSLYVKDGGIYKVFGYLPATMTDADPSVLISGGIATLTINQMLTVSNQDVCVITGVKGATTENVNPVALSGLFDYKAIYTNKGYGLSVLADHIYAAVKLKFLVGADYSKLRTIKLKQVILKNMAKKVKVEIPLTMGSEETPVPKPIGTITMTDVTTSADANSNNVDLFLSSDGVTLKTDDAIIVTGYFAPGKISSQDTGLTTGLAIESVYDVYDTKGTLIREDCHAVNQLNSKLSGLESGQIKEITMTVIPTYLYVLSDPDADTPMVVAGD